MQDLSRIKKHIGVYTTTGVRCIVVFRKIPGDNDNCLVVETDHLTDMYHDNIIEMVNSKEAKETNEFSEILNRRTFSDGLNSLQALHYKGFLRKVPVSQVVMIPFPNQQVPLEMINAQIDGTADEYLAKEAKKKEEQVAKNKKEQLFDPNDPVGIATGLLLQADLLENEAKIKRSEAYDLAPELNPEKGIIKKKRGRPKLTPEEKMLNEQKRKEKRRQRDRVNDTKQKLKESEEKMQDAINDKLVRDLKRKEDDDDGKEPKNHDNITNDKSIVEQLAL